MNYQEIKNKRQADYNALLNDLGVFWAFSNEQFAEGLKKAKETMQEGEKITDIGAGGFMPSKNVNALIKGTKEIERAFKKAIKDAKARQEHIIYELNNHEAFYTGEIEDTLDALGQDYTHAEVLAVYKDYKAKKYARPTVEADYIGKLENNIINKHA